MKNQSSAANTPKMRSCCMKGPSSGSSSSTGQLTPRATRNSVSFSFSPGTRFTRNLTGAPASDFLSPARYVLPLSSARTRFTFTIWPLSTSARNSVCEIESNTGRFGFIMRIARKVAAITARTTHPLSGPGLAAPFGRARRRGADGLSAVGGVSGFSEGSPACSSFVSSDMARIIPYPRARVTEMW